MQYYINQKVKHEKDLQVEFTNQINHFRTDDDVFITDYLINKLRDIEPFIV
jgi:hypothetical protein